MAIVDDLLFWQLHLRWTNRINEDEEEKMVALRERNQELTIRLAIE